MSRQVRAANSSNATNMVANNQRIGKLFIERYYAKVHLSNPKTINGLVKLLENKGYYRKERNIPADPSIKDDIINANHESAQRFMEDMELAVLNQDHTQI